MKLSYVLGIYLTNIVIRSSFGIEDEDVLLLLLLLGLRAFYQRYIRNITHEVIIRVIDDSNGSKSTIQPTSTVPTTPVTEPRLLACNLGYTLYDGPGTRFCYRYDRQCLSWNDARLACQQEGTDLAVLDDPSLPAVGVLMNAIFQAGPRSCSPTAGIWIGARTRLNDFVAVNIDGTTISSENPLWQAGHPFIHNRCVQYNTDVNDQRIVKLATQSCVFDAAFICQQRR